MLLQGAGSIHHPQDGGGGPAPDKSKKNPGTLGGTIAHTPMVAIADHRRPGHRMRHLAFKLPEEAFVELEALAGDLQVHRSQVARQLLLRGLAAERAEGQEGG